MKKNLISTAVKSLDPQEIESLAVKSGFKVRKAKKITPVALLHSYCMESINNSLSFNDISGILNDYTGNLPSRQAVGKRINETFIIFLEMILERVLGDKVDPKEFLQENSYFSRILVQDSTIVKLPSHLFNEFSGASNGHVAACNSRIQGVYDLIAKKFLSFSIDKYSRNDFDAASELVVQAGDLVLRDRGYLKYDELKRIQNADAFFIYRHASTMYYRDPETDEKIDLAKLLKKNGHIDMDVCLNNKMRTPVRIVSAPVSEETANLRRMKEKRKLKGHKPSENLLFLMSWTVFITNLPRSEFSFETILSLYGLRWRIETIFKTWKSNMSFTTIHRVSSQQVRAMLIARFITITITMHCVYERCEGIIATYTNKLLSISKLMRHIQVNKERLMKIIVELAQDPVRASISLSRFCSYDKRKRLNYVQCEARILGEIGLS